MGRSTLRPPIKRVGFRRTPQTESATHTRETGGRRKRALVSLGWMTSGAKMESVRGWLDDCAKDAPGKSTLSRPRLVQSPWKVMTHPNLSGLHRFGVQLQSPIRPQPLRGVRRVTAGGDIQRSASTPENRREAKGEPSGFWQQGAGRCASGKHP